MIDVRTSVGRVHSTSLEWGRDGSGRRKLSSVSLATIGSQLIASLRYEVFNKRKTLLFLSDDFYPKIPHKVRLSYYTRKKRLRIGHVTSGPRVKVSSGTVTLLYLVP